MQNQPGGAPPVFVDRTGRRRRLTVVAGTAMGLGLLTSLGLILAGLFFDSSVSLPGWSDTKVNPPIEAGVNAPGQPGEVNPSPHPTPVTSTSAPLPAPSTTSSAGTATRTTAPAPQPSTSTGPGLGDERRSTAKPSRTPGKP